MIKQINKKWLKKQSEQAADEEIHPLFFFTILSVDMSMQNVAENAFMRYAEKIE